MATVKEEALPLVLVHRPPNFHFPFKHHLQTHFRLLDPLDSDPPESTHSFFSCHAASVALQTSVQLGGKRVGIVGLGSIGAKIAKRLEPFGCAISYNSRRKKPSVPFPWFKNVYDLAVNNDVLIVCCMLTEESRHIIRKDIMTALGKEGVIINVGRGALIDEKELVQLLVRGELRGAGLDVFENEPDVPQELFSLKNVVLSPHCAAATPECFDALEELITANLHAFFSSKPLQSVVELE
ncbi:hypothetical protein Godav_007226 [Gossypium davidsonii]|uniref:D-isomer specific 2-hydroxyacid dehydrogenase NAD-binding domain-containing protein n=1 Tax=Gossypium davidsonii TaxID=34287 RepID=A0A7J8S6W6_GOSDV|nr:hypothetical protein [Gossypium davidsonii]